MKCVLRVSAAAAIAAWPVFFELPHAACRVAASTRKKRACEEDEKRAKTSLPCSRLGDDDEKGMTRLFLLLLLLGVNWRLQREVI